jgi:hypothetical protein
MLLPSEVDVLVEVAIDHLREVRHSVVAVSIMLFFTVHFSSTRLMSLVLIHSLLIFIFRNGLLLPLPFLNCPGHACTPWCRRRSV